MSQGKMETLVDKATMESIRKLFSKIDSTKEFEAMFFNINPDSRLNLESYLRSMEYLRARAKISRGKLELISTQTLDISYNATTDKEQALTSYRISVSGLDQINRYIRMFHLRRNHVIFKSLLKKIQEKEPHLELIKKVKNLDNFLDIPDLDLRFRLSDELKISAAEIEQLMGMDEVARTKIGFRYKERVSLVVTNDSNYRLAIDLTSVKRSNSINRIDGNTPRYELEIELLPKKKLDKKALDQMLTEIMRMLKLLQQSNFVITRQTTERVITTYKELLGITGSIYSLQGRQAHSLELQAVVDVLPSRYSVTDKADGDRYGLIIVDNHVYLISNNLVVKDTGIHLGQELSNYNGTVLDGELIFIPRKNRYAFMVFDCLRSGSTNVRDESRFMVRLEHADKLIKDCFVLGKQRGHLYKQYTGTVDDAKYAKFHQEQIRKMMDALNYDIDLEKRYPLVRRKYFIPVTGAKPNEIFKAVTTMWNSFTADSKVRCPYILDGLVLHPMEQKYITSSRESKFHEYKWKPLDKNSIDFYVTFMRSKEDGQIVTLYDNAKDETMRGRPYRVCYLHVGRQTRNGEQPVLFQKETGKYFAYMFLQDGEVRDLDGKLIKDKTVVEFYYNNDASINERFRWVPIRTRYDKTETMMTIGKKFGNYYEIANRVWRSIANPILMKDFDLLAKDKLYPSYSEKLRGKIDHSLIVSKQKEDAYYQEKKNLAMPMRNYHNFIKSNLIYVYCNPIYNQGRKLSVLDIACGKGGDLAKFHHARVSYYVGLDVDNAGLVHAFDSALSRYRRFKDKYTNFPKMHFIHADGGVKLNYADQLQRLGSMSPMNKDMLERFFDPVNPTTFDCINCQFALHYFLRDQTSWDNYCYNLKTHLNPGGYFLATCFDGTAVYEKLSEQKSFASYYTDKKGDKRKMFEMIKRYPEDLKRPFGVGNAVDIHNNIYMQDDHHETEYLVDPEFLIKELSEKCDMELIESDRFETIFNVESDFFKRAVPEEEFAQTKKFLSNSGRFYDLDNEENKASFEMSRLNRFYVFKKRGKVAMGKDDKKRMYEKTTHKERFARKEKEQQDKPKSEKPKRGRPKKQKQAEQKQTGGGVTRRGKKKQAAGGKESLDRISYLLGTGCYRKRVADPDHSFGGSILDALHEASFVPKSVDLDRFSEDVGLGIPKDIDLDKDQIRQLCKLELTHQTGKKAKKVVNGLNIFVISDDCDGDVEIKMYSKTKRGYSKRSKNLILSYDGDRFAPVYDQAGKGIFSASDTIISNLLLEV